MSCTMSIPFGWGKQFLEIYTFPLLASSIGGMVGRNSYPDEKHINPLVCIPCQLACNLKATYWQIYQVTNLWEDSEWQGKGGCGLGICHWSLVQIMKVGNKYFLAYS